VYCRTLRTVWLRRLKLYRESELAVVEAGEHLFAFTPLIPRMNEEGKFIDVEHAALSDYILDKSHFSDNPLIGNLMALLLSAGEKDAFSQHRGWASS